MQLSVVWLFGPNAGLTLMLLWPLKVLKLSKLSLGRTYQGHIQDISETYLGLIWDLFWTYLGHI